ncbi:LysR family transcriptional regulator [Bradyrhizobium jicamae]|uniref:LysR family transcriptional regulator n=1 Tax=Bradyrhizobium jicamae TaxID=280332 RepID=UPI001BA4A74F|nr:LysR family transcriptional regulator [Bradyrhizobium jicamae]MBR0754341.1 LysR family transcriptional regulator [Bradyrhizobium jicamae]
MTLEVQQLAAFLAISKHGSIGRAAVAMDLTQPAVTRALKRLEHRLGTVLFERHPSGVIPTPAADSLLPYAEEIVSNAKAALEQVASLRGHSSSIVRIGAVASMSNSIVPEVINRLLVKWPSLRVQLLDAVEDQLSEALARREIDVAIAGFLQESEVPFLRRDGLTDSLVAFAHPEHALAKKGRLTLHDIATARWVLPPRSILPMQEFVRRFRDAGLVPPEATVETRSNGAIRALVGTGQFISWQPRVTLQAESRSRIVELDVPDLLWHREFYVYRRKRGILAPAAVRFLHELQELCRGSVSKKRRGQA